MRLVLSTVDGEKITEAEVGEELKLVSTVATWIQAAPTACIYLDGKLLSDEARLAMLLAMAADAARSAPSVSPTSEPAAPMPDADTLKDYNETLKRGFDDVRKGNLDSMREFLGCIKQLTDLAIAREKEFADEAARQRALTRKSLADIDLLDRSVSAVRFGDVIATAAGTAPVRAHRSRGMNGWDFLGGVMKVLGFDDK
jgi:hypothetical protein